RGRGGGCRLTSGSEHNRTHRMLALTCRGVCSTAVCVFRDVRRASLPARLPIEAMILCENAAGRRALPLHLPLPLPILHTQNTDSASPPYYTSTARRCRRRRCGGRLP